MDANRLSEQQTEDAIRELVRSRYPHEVAALLVTITDPDDRVIVVASALARSLALGRTQGREMEKADLRRRLGL